MPHREGELPSTTSDATSARPSPLKSATVQPASTVPESALVHPLSANAEAAKTRAVRNNLWAVVDTGPVARTSYILASGMSGLVTELCSMGTVHRASSGY